MLNDLEYTDYKKCSNLIHILQKRTNSISAGFASLVENIKNNKTDKHKVVF